MPKPENFNNTLRQQPWAPHPALLALCKALQISSDCWNLLAAPDGSSRKEHYLPKGEREPETAYRKRLDAARPSGFFRDALRTYAGMLSRGNVETMASGTFSGGTIVGGGLVAGRSDVEFTPESGLALSLGTNASGESDILALTVQCSSSQEATGLIGWREVV